MNRGGRNQKWLPDPCLLGAPCRPWTAAIRAPRCSIWPAACPCHPASLNLVRILREFGRIRSGFNRTYAIHCVHIAPCVLHIPCFPDYHAQRSMSVYFSPPVPPLPRAKREDVIDALLYFRFKDRITGHTRQKAYNEAQKACATLFLSVPMAALCEFVAVAQKMTTCDQFRQV